VKRLLLGLVAGAALATAVPASASVLPVMCGITPRYPCGVCYVDDATQERTCVSPRDLV
jgi:hypothetical protein